MTGPSLPGDRGERGGEWVREEEGKEQRRQRKKWRDNGEGRTVGRRGRTVGRKKGIEGRREEQWGGERGTGEEGGDRGKDGRNSREEGQKGGGEETEGRR